MFVIRRVKHDWSVAVFPSAGEILVLPSGKVLSPGDEVFVWEKSLGVEIVLQWLLFLFSCQGHIFFGSYLSKLDGFLGEEACESVGPLELYSVWEFLSC